MALKAFVVEDNPSIRQGLVDALADLAGIDTSGTATTEQGAVAWLTEPANRWDLAIVDLVLVPGGGSGFGVLRALKDRPPNRKMVVLTGSASPDVRKQCLALGCDGVFDKAMETEALIDYCIALARAQAPGA
ncbi:response regulator transcription factor [Ramlibacter sp.]|uniref:response regulator transcription factor n=1 Tax=Ramlibacter sp. TaxID=1917967 RepID=UPI003D127145